MGYSSKKKTAKLLYLCLILHSTLLFRFDFYMKEAFNGDYFNIIADFFLINQVIW